MRLFRRKNANGTWTWWAAWSERHHETGRTVTRRRSTKCTTRPAAELVYARWERERADPVYAAANAATFGEEVVMFLTACRGAVERGKMAPETLAMYRQKCASLVHFLGSDLRLAEIDQTTFAGYLERRREHGQRDEDGAKVKDIAETTLYKEWVAFSGVLTQAWKAERFGRDPRSLKPAHFGPEYKPRETFLTWQQADALLSELEGDHRRAVAFALAFGARRSEVFAARAGDVSLKSMLVRIRGLKTEAADATLPIATPMVRWAKIAGQPPFAAWSNARRGLARACGRANVPVVTWNDLRRTFASLLVQRGVAPHIVARLLRHTTTAMVDRVYGRTDAASLGALLRSQLGGSKRRATREPHSSRSGRRRTD